MGVLACIMVGMFLMLISPREEVPVAVLGEHARSMNPDLPGLRPYGDRETPHVTRNANPTSNSGSSVRESSGGHTAKDAGLESIKGPQPNDWLRIVTRDGHPIEGAQVYVVKSRDSSEMDYLERILRPVSADTSLIGASDARGTVGLRSEVRRLWIAAPGYAGKAVLTSGRASGPRDARTVALGPGGTLRISVNGWSDKLGLSAYLVAATGIDHVTIGQDGAATLEGIPVGEAEIVIRYGHHWEDRLDGPPPVVRQEVTIARGVTSSVFLQVDSTLQEVCRLKLRVSEQNGTLPHVDEVKFRGASAQTEATSRKLLLGRDFEDAAQVKTEVPKGNYRLSISLEKYVISKDIRLERDYEELDLRLPPSIAVSVSLVTAPGEVIPPDSNVSWHVRDVAGDWRAFGNCSVEGQRRSTRFYVPAGVCTVTTSMPGYLPTEDTVGMLSEGDAPSLVVRLARAGAIAMQLSRGGKRIVDEQVRIGYEEAAEADGKTWYVSLEQIADGEDILIDSLRPGRYTLYVGVGDADAIEVKEIIVVTGQRTNVPVQIK